MMEKLSLMDEIDYEAEKIGIHQDAKRIATMINEFDKEGQPKDFFGETRDNLLRVRNELDFFLIKLSMIEQKYKG